MQMGGTNKKGAQALHNHFPPAGLVIGKTGALKHCRSEDKRRFTCEDMTVPVDVVDVGSLSMF